MEEISGSGLLSIKFSKPLEFDGDLPPLTDVIDLQISSEDFSYSEQRRILTGYDENDIDCGADSFTWEAIDFTKDGFDI
jgi:hypothetical protein